MSANSFHRGHVWLAILLSKKQSFRTWWFLHKVRPPTAEVKPNRTWQQPANWKKRTSRRVYVRTSRQTCNMAFNLRRTHRRMFCLQQVWTYLDMFHGSLLDHLSQSDIVNYHARSFVSRYSIRWMEADVDVGMHVKWYIGTGDYGTESKVATEVAKNGAMMFGGLLGKGVKVGARFAGKWIGDMSSERKDESGVVVSWLLCKIQKFIGSWWNWKGRSFWTVGTLTKIQTKYLSICPIER
jgi:hypothetical protein